jgi:polyisoprenoid-binding protein YceI
MFWEIDPFYSLVEFSVWHLMINIVKGRFKEVHGTIQLDPKHPEESKVKAQVSAASIDTGIAPRDGHLRSADFFEVAKYPMITFESSSIQQVGAKNALVTGNLTLHGITQAVQFQAELTGNMRDPDTGIWRIGLSAVTTLDRRTFNIQFQQPNSKNTVVIGNEVRIMLHIEAVQI